MQMPRLTITLLGLGLLWVSPIQQNLSAQGAIATQEPVVQEDETEIDYIADLTAAKRSLKLSQLRMESMLLNQDLARLQASMSYESAAAELESYRLHDSEAEKAQAILDLQYQKDDLADAEEEFHQLGLMYDRNALADSTVQIVMERARRNIERQQSALALAEKAQRHWLQFGRAQEQIERQNTVRVAKAEVDAQLLGQAYERLEMEHEIDDFKTEIQSLEIKVKELKD